MEEYIKQIDELRKQNAKLLRKYQSENLNELFTALSKAQAEIKPVKKNKKNPFYKNDYADLKAVVEVSRLALTSHGLSVIQIMESNNGDGQFMITRLCHASGQWIESRLKLQPTKSDVQSLGSYITYIRRYTYASLIGVVDTDEDDDGEGAVIHKKEEQEKPQFVTDQQLAMLEKALEGSIAFKAEILKSLEVSTLKETPSERFDNLYKYILQEKLKAKK